MVVLLKGGASPSPPLAWCAQDPEPGSLGGSAPSWLPGERSPPVTEPPSLLFSSPPAGKPQEFLYQPGFTKRHPRGGLCARTLPGR